MNQSSLFLIAALTASTAFAAPSVYPDKKLTPGATDPKVTQSTIHQTICKPGYTASVRAVTRAMHEAVFRAYNIPYSEHSNYEDDHFVSLELGGSNVIANRWPEAYCPSSKSLHGKPRTCFGAIEKDVVETNLHLRICNGEITLEKAQEIIRTDWLAEYKRIQGLK